MPNITTNHAITYTNCWEISTETIRCKQRLHFRGLSPGVWAGVRKVARLIPRKCSLCSQGTETTSLETNKIVWPFKWDLFGDYFFQWYYIVIENIVLKTLRLWTERYFNIWARLLIGICRPVGYRFWGSLSLNRLLLLPCFDVVFLVWS